jgi:hypothetical protein
MSSLLSSPARLTDAVALSHFEEILLNHGVLGYRAGSAAGISEEDRLSAVPLVFGLLPAEAINRRDVQIKPHIMRHLTAIGILPTASLVSILKRVSDHYAATSPNRPEWLAKPRKESLAGLRLNGQLYRQIRGDQGGRCAICGVDLDRVLDVEEALDHIIPWRLVGDPPDGANWRLLCSSCNGGKSDYMTTLLSPAAWNWIYREGTGPDGTGGPDRATRYVVLAQRGYCSVEGCYADATTSQLFLERLVPSGLAVADNLSVVCEAHNAF